MTPKEQYEARKAERKERRARLEYKHSESEIREQETLDMLDRFVTAAERIAEALERPST